MSGEEIGVGFDRSVIGWKKQESVGFFILGVEDCRSDIFYCNVYN